MRAQLLTNGHNFNVPSRNTASSERNEHKHALTSSLTMSPVRADSGPEGTMIILFNFGPIQFALLQWQATALLIFFRFGINQSDVSGPFFWTPRWKFFCKGFWLRQTWQDCPLLFRNNMEQWWRFFAINFSERDENGRPKTSARDATKLWMIWRKLMWQIVAGIRTNALGHSPMEIWTHEPGWILLSQRRNEVSTWRLKFCS